MALMSLKKIESRDIRRVSIHECAHAIVSRYYGAIAYPFIWKNQGSDIINENTWFGQTMFSGAVLTRMQSRRVSMAGNIAEDMDNENQPTKEQISEIEYNFENSFGETYEESEGWSQSDWELAQGWKIRDIRAIHSILLENWGFLIKEAKLLISKGRKNGTAITRGSRLSKIRNDNSEVKINKKRQ